MHGQLDRPPYAAGTYCRYGGYEVYLVAAAAAGLTVFLT